MPNHDRNLLFGLLALQNNVVGEDDLLKAFREWTREKSQTIEQVLRDQKAVTDKQCERLEGLLLDTSNATAWPRRASQRAPAIASLRGLVDEDLNVSLGHLCEAPTNSDLDPFATRNQEGLELRRRWPG